MKKLLLLFALIFFTGTLFAQIPDGWNDKLDEELAEILKTWNASGFAVAVVEKDKVIYAKGFGYRDYENKLPVTTKTLFAIGSSSKSFTSALLGILKDEGKLSFEDRPAQYIPELRFFNDELNNRVTVRDIITHRTGLPRHDLSWYFFPTQSRDSLIQRIQYLEPFKSVRETWYYNNFMYLTQGVIAEKLLGKPWEDLIKEKFFDPLEMRQSNAKISGLKQGNDVAKGYTVKKDSTLKLMDYYDIAAMGPAGSINSNVEEMANWMSMWLNGGKYKGKEILSSTYVQEAMSPHMLIANAMPSADAPDLFFNGYGFGWMISSYKGHYRVEHGGNIDGFSANVALFPMDSLGIVVLSNQNGSAIPNLVRNTISDRVLGVHRTEWNKNAKERAEKAKADSQAAAGAVSSNQKKGTRPSHHPAEFEGEYSHPGYGKLSIDLVNDSLFVTSPLKKFYLKHFHYDVFSVVDVSETQVDTTELASLKFNFQTNEQGEIASLEFKAEPTLDPLVFKRKPKVSEVDEKSLERLVGEYDLAGMTSKFYTKENLPGTLFLFVPGQPEYELVPIGKDKFSIKIAEGFAIEFLENEEGIIHEAKFIQPNGIFVAKKK